MPGDKRSAIAILVSTLIIVQFFAYAPATAEAPTQIYNPIIITIETNASAEITNTSGAQAIFQGSITNTAPLMKVNVTFKIESSGWAASADPQSMDFQGRTNKSFKFLIEVPAGVANGTIGTAKATIAVQGTAPGRAYNDTVSQTLMATALNSEYKTGNDGGTGGPHGSVNITVTTSHNNTALTPASLLTPYIPFIAAFAVVGIILGVAIKVKARRDRRKAMGH